MGQDRSEEDERLPVPVEGAHEIAKLTTSIATAVVSLWFPPAVLVQPVINALVERRARHSEAILIDRLKERGVEAVSPEQVAEYVPMAYRFFEAAKEGEYEHNIQILAALIAAELNQDVPDAPNFARMARRLEGITRKELAVMVLADARMSELRNTAPEGAPFGFVCASNLKTEGTPLTARDVGEGLTELSSRGLLTPDGVSRYEKHEEYYTPTQAFDELIARAKDEIVTGVTAAAVAR